MLHRLALVAIIAVLPAFAFAEDKEAAKKPSGIFVRGTAERMVTWTFKGDTLKINVKLGEGSLAYDADYGVTKEGLLFAIFTKAEKKGIDGGPGKDDLISLRYTLSKGELKISEFKGTAVDDEAKRLVEGTYKEEKSRVTRH